MMITHWLLTLAKKAKGKNLAELVCGGNSQKSVAKAIDIAIEMAETSGYKIDWGKG